jgi:hypothetical protein
LNTTQVFDDFDAHILRAVDKALLAVGELGRRSFFQYLESGFGVKHDEIPKRLRDFHEALSVIFGRGTEIVEKIMTRELCHQCQIDLTVQENWTIVEYVSNIKENIKTRTK